jgi:hypothetical protein
VFERHRAKEAQAAYEAQLAEWTQQRDESAHMLAVAQTYAGETVSDKLLLKASEHLIGTVSGVGLIEERRGAGQWKGASHGVSIPVGGLGGHEVRYRVGQTRGHYAQGAPMPTAIDTGTLFITDQRAVFEGARQTRECAFAKLLGVTYGADGSATFSVSNRQKPTTVHYGHGIAGWVHFRIELGLARFRGTVPALVSQLQEQLAALDRSKPIAPAVTP